MKALSVILLISLSLAASAQDSIGVLDRRYRYSRLIVEASDMSFNNPALRPYEHATSLSTVDACVDSYRESEAVDPRRGRGHDYWQAGAESYIHHRSSTLWGHAYYRSGKDLGIKFNETVDYGIIYPYLTADDIGGDLSHERYSLCGGYADRRSRWNWGAELSYEAGIYYRRVDPRPKDVTGLLDVRAGLAYAMPCGYAVGVAADAHTYRQSCDILFVSEAGRTAIYHPTGLEHRYNRFTGASTTSRYSGTQFGAVTTLYPATNRGVVATISLSQFRLVKTLVDLNKLPLCRVRHHTIKAQVGYLAADWSASVQFEAYNRRGYESIFGDATANVYPKLGELAMYCDDRYSISAKAVREWTLAESARITCSASAGLSHRRQRYIDPATERGIAATFIADYYRLLAAGWGIDARLRTELLTSCVTALHASCHLSRAVSHSRAIGLALAYGHGFWSGGIASRHINVSLQFIF